MNLFISNKHISFFKALNTEHLNNNLKEEFSYKVILLHFMSYLSHIIIILIDVGENAECVLILGQIYTFSKFVGI